MTPKKRLNKANRGDRAMDQAELVSRIEDVGDDMCSYCGKFTTCLSLSDDGEVPRYACYDCVLDAFMEWRDIAAARHIQ